MAKKLKFDELVQKVKRLFPPSSNGKDAKYKLTDEVKSIGIRDVKVHRIVALRDFADVKAGDVGGWVEGEHNLSHEGNAWVYDDAIVMDRAVVEGEGQVRDEARISDDARVRDNAVVGGRASVLEGARIYGNAVVKDMALLTDFASVGGNAVVEGKTFVCEIYDGPQDLPMSEIQEARRQAGKGKSIDPKYKLSDEIRNDFGRLLHRIVALRDFSDIKAGDVGGWVEGEHNLSQDGNAWVGDNASVLGNARVSMDGYVGGVAVVMDNAWIRGSAVVSGMAVVKADAMVEGNAEVSEQATVGSFACVTNSAKVHGNAVVDGHVSGNAEVFERATVKGEVCDNAIVNGHATICCGAHVKDNAVVGGRVVAFGGGVRDGDVLIMDEGVIMGNAVLGGGDANSGLGCDNVVAEERGREPTVINLDIKHLPLTEFMKALGQEQPVSADGNLRVYNTPYEDKPDPSLVINIETNQWRDTRTGAYGGIYDLAYELTGSCNMAELNKYISGEMSAYAKVMSEQSLQGLPQQNDYSQFQRPAGMKEGAAKVHKVAGDDKAWYISAGVNKDISTKAVRLSYDDTGSFFAKAVTADQLAGKYLQEEFKAALNKASSMSQGEEISKSMKI